VPVVRLQPLGVLGAVTSFARRRPDESQTFVCSSR
jgi:hypothetical protein